ncbi:MAG: beta-ketoacyl-ACP synthase II [Gemmatimonas sp.]|nr:beta-ketoacyl-ACP synthase II [Gemmatimonas sp.]
MSRENDVEGVAGSRPRRVAVSGLGCITPIGNEVDGLWDGLQRRKSAVRRISRFDPSPFRSHIAAQVDEFDVHDYVERSRAKRMDRFAQFSVACARMALDDAGLDPSSLDQDRAAVQVGSALGGVALAEDQYHRYLTQGPRAVSPFLALSVFGGSASCNIAIEFGFTGANATNSMSCASGAIALGEAWRLVRDGAADIALAGGVEAPLSPLSYGAFAILRAMSTRNDDPERASRPFDVDRDGFVMGEGAAILVLEDLEHARTRGARIYAELCGYGTTNDAFHMTAPRPDGRQAARAMRLALHTAGVAPDQVDYVNAHASSTPLNDSTESRIIRDVFGDHAESLAISGTKGYHAHSLGATGAIEAVITSLAMHRGWIPPTLNLETPDPGCDLPYINGNGDSRPVRYAISNSFGFGGINAALLFRAPPPDVTEAQ